MKNIIKKWLFHSFQISKQFKKNFTTSSIITQTNQNKFDNSLHVQPIFSNISNPEILSDIFLKMKYQGDFNANHVLLQQMLTTLKSVSLENYEKFSLVFLMNLMEEIPKIPKNERELLYEVISPILTLHLQKQEFDGFLKLLSFINSNSEYFETIFEKQPGFLNSCIQENFNYFAMSCSLDLLNFFPLMKCLSEPPYNFSKDFLKTGPALKLGNKVYSKTMLSKEEMEGLLTFDEEVISQKQVLQKILEFIEKKPEESESLELEGLIKIVWGLHMTRFDFNLGVIEYFEFLINKKTNESFKSNKKNLDIWVKLINYYFLTNQTDKIISISDESVIQDLEEAIVNKKKSIYDRKIMICLEIASTILTFSKKENMEKIINLEWDAISFDKKKDNFRFLYVSVLFSKHIQGKTLEYFGRFLSNINLDDDNNHSELIYAWKTLKFLKISKDLKNSEIKIQELEYKLEIYLNKILKKPIETLLKDVFQFVELISIKYELFPNRKELIEKILQSPLLKTLNFNDIINMNLALRKVPIIHHIFIEYFLKKLREFAEKSGLDLIKIHFLCKSLLGFKEVLRDGKLSTLPKDKLYVGRFRNIIGILQEELLKVILKEMPKKQLELKQNIFEKFEAEENNPGDKNKQKKNGLKQKSSDKLSEITLEDLFKDLEIKDLNYIYLIFQDFVEMNMGTIPMHYMFWKIIERFQSKFNNKFLIDWLYRLGNINRLPKDLPKDLEARLEDPLFSSKLNSLSYLIKYLWIKILKNPQQLPLNLMDFITKSIKASQNNLNSLEFQVKIRFYQIMMLLNLQDNKTYDPFFGISKEIMNGLKMEYENFLKNSRKTLREFGKTTFQNEIESYLRKQEFKSKPEVIIEYQGFPILLMDYMIGSENNVGYAYIMDHRIFLEFSNIELIEGWLMRRMLKALKIKVKFLEYSVYSALEKRHERNTYIKTKLKALGLESQKAKKDYDA